jgi:hypothetical protein
MTRETVQWCTVCGCKTWFLDGVCEWSDGPISPANCIASDRSSSALDHRLQQARREIEPEIEHTVAWFYEKSETTEAICRRCGLWRRADGNCWRRMEDCPMVEETVAREGQVDE